MSRETMTTLGTDTRIGFTDKRGNAWHYRKGTASEQNHFPGAVPFDAVLDLFKFQLTSAPLRVQMPDSFKPQPIEIEAGILVDDPYGMMPLVEGKQAIFRDDTGKVLGIFAEGYEIHQYREWLLHHVSNIIGDTLAIGSAGLLKGGAQGWVSIEVPENIKTPEGVEFRPNLLACTSCDGSLATTYKRIVTNVVCDNTMCAGLGEVGQQLKIKHSRYSKLRINEARSALAMIETVADDFQAEVKALCELTVTERQWTQFLDAHAPIVDPRTGIDKVGRGRTIALNEREQLTQLWNNDNRVSPWRGTGWGVMQAVNTFTHHLSTVRNVSRPERNMSNAVTGKTDTLDRETVGTLMQVVGAR
jgi:phage/plasmid-like protein (TIGR03299 family)